MINMKLISSDSPILTTPCIPIKFVTSKMRLFAKQMYVVMIDNNGVGLAAPQVGLNMKFFIMREFPNKMFVNPVIKPIDDELINSYEGCLSLPGIHINVPRFKKIQLSYMDGHNDYHTEIFENNLSCIIQHETDHTNGILITKYNMKEG